MINIKKSFRNYITKMLYDTLEINNTLNLKNIFLIRYGLIFIYKSIYVLNF